jgi:MFS family permease
VYPDGGTTAPGDPGASTPARPHVVGAEQRDGEHGRAGRAGDLDETRAELAESLLVAPVGRNDLSLHHDGDRSAGGEGFQGDVDRAPLSVAGRDAADGVEPCADEWRFEVLRPHETASGKVEVVESGDRHEHIGEAAMVRDHHDRPTPGVGKHVGSVGGPTQTLPDETDPTGPLRETGDVGIRGTIVGHGLSSSAVCRIRHPRSYGATVTESAYTPRVLALLGAGVAYFTVAGMSFPVLPRLVEDELGGSRTDIGLAFGFFALGMLMVRPIAGVVSDRIGRRPLMIGGALGVAAFQLLHVPAADTGQLWVLLLVRVGTGGFSSLMYLAQATTATELPPAEHRAKVFSTFSVAVFVGFAIGPILGESVLQAHGFGWTFAVASGFAAASGLVALALPETKPDEVRPAEGIRDLFHPVAARIGLVNLLIFIAFMGFNAFIQPYSEEFGIEEARWLLLTYSGTTLVLRFAGGWVFDRVDRRNLATFAHLTVAGGALLLATATDVSQLYLGAFVIAIGMAWNVPLLMLIAVDSATDVDRSKVVATVTTFGDLANSAGALMLGVVADAVDYEGMYVVVAGAALLAVLLMRSGFMAPVVGLRRAPQPAESLG